jgi:DNA-binding MarR family transcriptional regulator
MSAECAIETWERLAQFHQVTTKAMDENLRARCDHSLDDYDVLHQIFAHGAPIRMGDLAERLVVANSSCNRIVGRLVEAELLSRTHGDGDRREVFVGLTAEGQRQHRRMAAVHTRDIEHLVGSPISTSERKRLDDTLRKLLSDVGEATTRPVKDS